ncbi:MAG: SGNH/GDSL hydrolase family protein [Oscillospiraceae bacterium]
MSISVSAEETASPENITILGDSISTGYGLDENELSYGDYLRNYFNAELDNFAVNGRQTSELISQLEEDSITVSSVANADIVCVSIGGNDVLHIFEDAVYELGGITQSPQSGSFQLSPEFIQQFLMKYSSGFGPAAAQAAQNLETISGKIAEINPEAEIVFQTIYNPFESDDETINNILKPLKTYTSLYLGTINNAVREQNVSVADIAKKFSENAWLYTNIGEFDIHPNNVGHMLIAEEIVQMLKLPGNYSVFDEQSLNLSEDTMNQLPENVTAEIKNLSEGNFRTESEIEVSAETERAIETTESATESTENKQKETTSESEKNSVKNKTAGILFKAGLCIIVISLILKIYARKRKDKKTK